MSHCVDVFWNAATSGRLELHGAEGTGNGRK